MHVLPVIVAVLSGCSVDLLEARQPLVGSLDDTLRMHHLQAVGTHNSYHAEPALGRPEWDYRHAPLWEQAAFQGVRQFELDLYWNDDREGYDVLHIPVLDPISSCPTLRDCLWSQRVWSDSAPGHHPIVTLLEVKDGDVEDEDVVERLAAIEAVLLDVWERERLLTPDDIRGDSDTVRDALAPDGWPVMRGLRQRAIYVLHAGGPWREVYTQGGEDVVGNLIFQDAYGDLDVPYAAIHSMNNPFNTDIADVVASGHLVRTRADSDVVEPANNDTRKRDAALASGAHFVSTDFPIPHPDSGYVVEMPDGTPSRCNPVTGPDECVAEAIEVGL
jgi:hypothetical protein